MVTAYKSSCVTRVWVHATAVCVKCRRVAVNLKRSEISEYKLRIKRVGELEMLSPFNWSERCFDARRWRCRVVGGVAKATEPRRATEPPPSRSRGRGARRGAVEIVRLRRVPKDPRWWLDVLR